MAVPPTAHTYPQLPAKPDLAQLKKQAKDLRRLYVQGDAATLDKVRQHFNPNNNPELTLAEAPNRVLALFFHSLSWFHFSPEVRAGDSHWPNWSSRFHPPVERFGHPSRGREQAVVRGHKQRDTPTPHEHRMLIDSLAMFDVQDGELRKPRGMLTTELRRRHPVVLPEHLTQAGRTGKTTGVGDLGNAPVGINQ